MNVIRMLLVFAFAFTILAVAVGAFTYKYTHRAELNQKCAEPPPPARVITSPDMVYP